MKKFLLFAVCLIGLSACNTKVGQSVTDSATAYTVPDEKAIDKAVLDAYGAICFKKGEQPRYNEIKNYFIPQAQLINFRADSMQVTNLDQFIFLYRSVIEEGKIDLFYEKELYGKTEQFGRIASRISTYKTYMNKLDTAEERGVNSFQLVKTPAGWKVSSIIWDVEKPALKIPGYYLGK
jgi:hypothetical protein